MINQDLLGRTVVGKVANRFNVKLNGYYIFLLIINILAAYMVTWDAKGIVVLFFTIGFSMVIRLMLTQRDEQRATNEILEEILERNVPLRPVK